MILPATCTTATNPIIPVLFKSEHGPAIKPQTLHPAAYRLITASYARGAISQVTVMKLIGIVEISVTVCSQFVSRLHTSTRVCAQTAYTASVFRGAEVERHGSRMRPQSLQ